MSTGNISSSTTSIQFLRADRAFKNIQTRGGITGEDLNKKINDEDTECSISSSNIKIKNLGEEIKKDEVSEKTGKYIGEIKEFISGNNYPEIPEEDIKEALNSGKSLLADYTA